MADEKRIVWILGAGFSKPLGGPLLKDLFTDASFRAINFRYGVINHPDFNPSLIRKVQYLYKKGRDLQTGIMWNDAEEFLDALDAAVETGKSSSAWKLIASLFAGSGLGLPESIDLQVVNVTAKRMLAAECAGFLKEAQLEREQWEPFIKWASGINEEDCIITFNYDLVLEKIREYISNKFNAVVVCDENQGIDRSAEILKLHGSIDWKMEEGDEYPVIRRMNNSSEYALSCPKEEMIIASPGPSKRKISGKLSFLWHRAESALVTCKAVVFIGYRFPPTDSRARTFILDCLRENTQTYLAIHTVLGPQSSEDSERLEQLLRWAMNGDNRVEVMDRRPQGLIANKQFNVRKHQLYAQDFFSVYFDDMILEPNKWRSTTG